MAPIKNVVLAGAGGLFGPYILRALQASPQKFNITLLQRPSSTKTFDPSLSVIKHDYDDPALASTLKEHNVDAMIVCASGSAILGQRSLIDACVAAGVQRFIPTEYGANTMNAGVRELLPRFQSSFKVIEKLKETAAEHPNFSWTGVCTGLWFDFAFQNDFTPYDLKEHKATIYDEGEQQTSYTTMGTAALAIARVLERPEETANQYLYISEIIASQNDVVAVLEKLDGVKYERIQASSKEIGEKAKEIWKGMSQEARDEPMQSPEGLQGLVAGFSCFMHGPGCDMVWGEGRNANKVLGIEEVDVETALMKALGK